MPTLTIPVSLVGFCVLFVVSVFFVLCFAMAYQRKMDPAHPYNHLAVAAEEEANDLAGDVYS